MSRLLPKRTCIFSSTNVQIILLKSKCSVLPPPTLLIKSSFSLHFSAVSVYKIINLTHCSYQYMIKQLIECTLYTFLEYICCSKFFNAFSFQYETWGNDSEHLHIRFPLPLFVYPSGNILGDFLLQASLKHLIEPLVCLFKVFSSLGFLK